MEVGFTWGWGTGLTFVPQRKPYPSHRYDGFDETSNSARNQLSPSHHSKTRLNPCFRVFRPFSTYIATCRLATTIVTTPQKLKGSGNKGYGWCFPKISL